MWSSRYGSWAVLGIVSCALGCAGNGDGLDQNGQPISADSGSSAPITADFQSIQDNVFTPICSKCHIGASAPEGLQLDGAHSYNLLVGVPSAEEPTLLRVKPSDPTDSYMLRKIEGAAGIEGGQMPLGEAPLPLATMDAIKQWISNGAPNIPTAGAGAFAVETTAPLDGAVIKAPVNRMLVTFTQEVDASFINDSIVTVERITPVTGDSDATTADSTSDVLPARKTLSSSNPAVLLIIPSTPLAEGRYRVILRGGSGALANLAATPLRSDRSFTFTVVPAQ